MLDTTSLIVPASPSLAHLSQLLAAWRALLCIILERAYGLRKEGKSCDAPVRSDIRYGRKVVRHKYPNSHAHQVYRRISGFCLFLSMWLPK